MKIYTSFYKKMLGRHKKEFDCYIKVSRSLYYPFKNVDGIYMKDLIDIDLDVLAPYGTLEDYAKDLTKDMTDVLYNNYKNIEDLEGNIFLLCFEDLDSCYTKADEKKHNGLVKAGEKKVCHRTILADFMNKTYGLDIKEFKDEYDEQ